MRRSWNEIRASAAAFARSWASAHYERGETQSFYNDFFEVFGVQRRKVATFEEPVRNLPGDRRGYIDLFWKGVLLVEQKSAGRPLARARNQALDYFPGLKDYELPRYILLCDFQTFELIDLETREEIRFALADLPRHVEKFGFIVGVERRVFKDQDPVNILASEQMGKLHDALKASGYDGHPLERLLVRLMFCMFADDTGIFERGSLEEYFRDRTREDGSDLGPCLTQIFEILNTPEERRQQNLDEDLGRFPYVNGDLFSEGLRIPSFDKAMRSRLLELCDFNWEKISPAIFGALFQSVMNAKERRKKGAHYTTERNILKVIEPLFLDDLRLELSRIKELKRGREQALRVFQDKLAHMKLFDPACGCGNFLVIAYRELRTLEIEMLKALYPHGQLSLDASMLSKVDVDQFYGIEIDEFPVRIAETAMWMMDHIMNMRLSAEFGQVIVRIPLKAAPHITNADALEISWSDVLPPEECTYVYGNPPFVGFVMRGDKQQAQAGELMLRLGASGKRLDYVAAWFLKAGEYLQRSHARVAFVATNSITQGEQVSQLWPALFHRWGLEIAFAHRTFAWGSDARGKAHVHVVVVALTRRDDEPPVKRLFSYRTDDADPDETRHQALSPYLFDASALSDRHLVVQRTRRPGAEMPTTQVGSKPVDGGYLILDIVSRDALLRAERDVARYVRPYVGAAEYLSGTDRWILALHGAAPQNIRVMPEVMAMLERVRRYRRGEIPPLDKPDAELKPPSKLGLSLAATPSEFHVTVIPDGPFLVIPEVSSQSREYIPVGWLEPPVVPSNKLIVCLTPSLHQFGLLTSKMHMAWTKFVGGRLKSDYQYSTGINYNPFPWPNLPDRERSRIGLLAQAVLDARAAHPGATLADLYEPDIMPPDLRHAHHALDNAVDRLYRSAPFSSDRERVEHLFRLYEQLVAPLTSKATAGGRRTVRRARAPAA
jgi:hypothetical protein